jgi:hypothetical protein
MPIGRKENNMLVIKVELWPHGDAERSKILTYGHIINDGTGDTQYGNYVGQLLALPKEPNEDEDNILYEGTVKEFKRSKGVVQLLQAMLNALERVDQDGS